LQAGGNFGKGATNTLQEDVVIVGISTVGKKERKKAKGGEGEQVQKCSTAKVPWALYSEGAERVYGDVLVPTMLAWLATITAIFEGSKFEQSQLDIITSAIVWGPFGFPFFTNPVHKRSLLSNVSFINLSLRH
jgi:hypothetical protein